MIRLAPAAVVCAALAAVWAVQAAAQSAPQPDASSGVAAAKHARPGPRITHGVVVGDVSRLRYEMNIVAIFWN